MRKRCFESERGLVVFIFALSVPSNIVDLARSTLDFLAASPFSLSP